MLNMTEASRRFLQENLPEALNAEKVNDALDVLYDWIELHGFNDEDLYNEAGKEAQKVYDDLFYHND
jgi:predicted house-cleaning noncanonical NTP pyrophosphatase (MazG superfamily)